MLLLRNLTQLTRLSLQLISMDDGTATALLARLTNLRSLKMVQQRGQQVLMSDSVVPALEHLKSLRKLSLYLPGVNESSLMLLEGLTQLSKLKVLSLSPESRMHLGRVLRCQVCNVV